MEREQTVFDTFVTRAAFPLHYVFADHWLLDVFVVDEATRSQPVRLWLTVLLDAYSRCVLGMTLLPEAPCIESIQQALQHALWPKTSHRSFGLEQDWVCYGIPQQLSLDNAWAHHSHSLESLARVLGQGGEYPSMDLLFRPPYKGRYGALVERFFGNLSQRVEQHLPGAIQSSHPRDVRQAARDARLLYTDVDRILHQLVLDYHHTPHTELNGLTPREQWLHGMAWTAAVVPRKPHSAAVVLALVAANPGVDVQRHSRLWYDLLVTGFTARGPRGSTGRTPPLPLPVRPARPQPNCAVSGVRVGRRFGGKGTASGGWVAALSQSVGACRPPPVGGWGRRT
ncbi:MAG: DDE-type integrase/transposase/recombinase [Chloroflexi bacterium]|nr:DDE-type integrase/transposase/recombinase [Chloroflexota bacterium]